MTVECGPTDTPDDIDIEALREKYAQERAKRLRADAIGQYQAPTGKLAMFARDPNADPHFTRDAVARAEALRNAKRARQLGINAS